MKSEQQRALDAIKTVKHGIKLKEIERLHKVIKRLVKQMDKHEELCRKEKEAELNARISHENNHRLATNSKEPCGLCISAMHL